MYILGKRQSFLMPDHSCQGRASLFYGGPAYPTVGSICVQRRHTRVLAKSQLDSGRYVSQIVSDYHLQ